LQKVRQQLGEELPFDPRALADLDLLLTDTFLTYGARASVGKAKLDRMDVAWFAKRQKADLVELLETAVESDRVADILVTLPPQHPGYARLRETLARYRGIVAHGGWPPVPAGPKLQIEDRDERVVMLRARLRVTGELVLKPRNEGNRRGAPSKTKRAPDSGESDTELLDATVAQAVRRFQRRHGLSPDGVVGDGTLAALNVSAEDRVQQIAVNMDRWRALPADLGPRHIDVNIPNFSLEVVENEQPGLRMKVVVGKMMDRRNTPTFSADMTSLVLNPYWYVPKSIAEEELFPLSRKDPQYLAKHNFTVRRVPVVDKRTSDPNATDGMTIAAKTYQYLLRQKPGPTNSLGQLKFMLPNAHGVYLHDTPAKELFNKTVRTFSHGCIRIEKPVDLAEYVLRGSSEWTRDAILLAIERQKQQTIWLPEPLPVYIQYWTAWVDQEGTVQFRNDIYGYDQVPGTHLPIPEPKILRAKTEPGTQPTVQPEPPQITQPDHQPAPLPEVRPML
jgi:murein L,D-transpeptidase YcbB/YkuD